MSGTLAICKIYHSLYAYADGANVIPAGELEPEPVFWHDLRFDWTFCGILEIYEKRYLLNSSKN